MPPRPHPTPARIAAKPPDAGTLFGLHHFVNLQKAPGLTPRAPSGKNKRRDFREWKHFKPEKKLRDSDEKN